jgi:hypothetical protein
VKALYTRRNRTDRLAAVTQLAFGQLQAADPTAAQAAVICAFLAPDPVPTAWFTAAAGFKYLSATGLHICPELQHPPALVSPSHGTARDHRIKKRTQHLARIDLSEEETPSDGRRLLPPSRSRIRP